MNFSAVTSGDYCKWCRAGIYIQFTLAGWRDDDGRSECLLQIDLRRNCSVLTHIKTSCHTNDIRRTNTQHFVCVSLFVPHRRMSDALHLMNNGAPKTCTAAFLRFSLTKANELYRKTKLQINKTRKLEKCVFFYLFFRFFFSIWMDDKERRRFVRWMFFALNMV